MLTHKNIPKTRKFEIPKNEKHSDLKNWQQQIRKLTGCTLKQTVPKLGTWDSDSLKRVGLLQLVAEFSEQLNFRQQTVTTQKGNWTKSTPNVL
jgi:hypothetical protein